MRRAVPNPCFELNKHRHSKPNAFNRKVQGYLQNRKEPEHQREEKSHNQSKRRRQQQQQRAAVSHRNPNMLPEPSFVKDLSDDDRDQHIAKGRRRRIRSLSTKDEKVQSRSTSRSHNPTRTNPRQYAANYYVSKLAPEDRRRKRQSDSPMRQCVESGVMVTQQPSSC